MTVNIYDMKTRIFGNQDDNQFWCDKPIQENHPKLRKKRISRLWGYSLVVTIGAIVIGLFLYLIINFMN